MLGVLVLHGIGRQEAGFSEPLRAAVFERLGAGAGRVVWQEVVWASILEPRESALDEAMRRAVDPQGVPIGLDWGWLRGFVLHNFGDAAAYQRDAAAESAGQLIHGRVSDAIEALQARLADPEAPVVVLAHSLGGHIASNYIWDRQRSAAASRAGDRLAPLPSLAGIITFGCNIPLFALAYRAAKPVDLPGAAVTNPAVVEAVRWLNFLDRDDVLGWPLRPLYAGNLDELAPAQRRTVDKLEDHEISVGFPPVGWTPAAHDRYWGDAALAGRIAGYLTSILAACGRREP